MSLSSGKVALVRNQTALTCGTGCVPNASIADFVGYGSSANSFEGSGPAPTLTNTTSASRAASGCTDSDNNGADFSSRRREPAQLGVGAAHCGGQDGGTGGATGAGGAAAPAAPAAPIMLPSPTLAAVHVANLSFGIIGDTRPASTTTGHYPSTVNTIISSIFTGLQTRSVPFVVGTGDYAFSTTGAGSAVPQYQDYMAARAPTPASSCRRWATTSATASPTATAHPARTPA